MGTSICNTEASLLLNARFGAGAFTAPLGHAVSLHIGEPGASDTPAQEASGGGYARQAATFGVSTGGGAILSTTTETFPNMPAGTYTDFVIHATGPGGVQVRPQTRGKLPGAGVTLLVGQSLTIAPGALSVAMQ